MGNVDSSLKEAENVIDLLKEVEEVNRKTKRMREYEDDLDKDDRVRKVKAKIILERKQGQLQENIARLKMERDAKLLEFESYKAETVAIRNQIDDLKKVLAVRIKQEKINASYRFVDSIPALEKELKETEEELAYCCDLPCTLCFLQEKNTVISPCMHTSCYECADKWCKDTNSCPLCREVVISYRKFYL